MFDSKKIENEIANLSALVGSIKTNAEKIHGTENAQMLIKGIADMCDIAEGKLSIIQKDVTEQSEVSKDV